MERKHIFLALAILGIILPYSQFISYMLDGGLDVIVMLELLFSNRISSFIAMDLFVSAIVFLFFVFDESKRLELGDLWIPLAGTFLVGMSFGFPIFLYLREKKIKR
jgi:hypothetical protein